MAKKSAGILMFREKDGEREYLLVHPGGPFWRKKDLGAWSIPKGEYEESEDPLKAAIREFEEETGTALSTELIYHPLDEVKQKGGKTVVAWAVEGEIDPEAITCNTFEMEWPPRSGKQQPSPKSIKQRTSNWKKRSKKYWKRKSRCWNVPPR